MPNFLDNLFGGVGDDKKKKAAGGPKNPFANINLPGQPRKFHGTGQSLGGSNPGKIVHIELKKPGTLGMKIEKRPNGGGTAIVSLVVEGTQAEEAGLMRGDILCFPDTGGQSEIMYDDFLAMANSGQRPLVFDIRRIQTKAASDTGSNNSNKKPSSADAYARKQAVIAAAEAREKAHKAKSKPVSKGEKKMSDAEKRQKEIEQERVAQLRLQEAPRSEEARQAMAAAKKSEEAWASQLGYNPYETNKSTAGQARNATVTSQHGSVGSGGGGSSGMSNKDSQPIPSVAPPTSPSKAQDDDSDHNDDAMILSQCPEFEEAYTTCCTSNSHEAVVKAFSIMRTLVKNVTTKGQSSDEAAAKFRRVRLANDKIKAAIVEVHGALDLMMAFGFQLTEENGESILAFPLGSTGPDFLPAAIRQMERYEKS